MHLVVQIPCYNEAASLPAVLADIPREIPGIDRVEVIVVDDGSHDGTAEVARAHGADHVIRHPRNRGLAAAFGTGLQAGLERGADVIVNTDGDHQYPGEAIAALVAPVVAGEADLVLGDRQPSGDARVPRTKRWLYRLGARVVRATTGLEIGDAPSGFRAMSRAFAVEVHLTNAFSYTLETLFLAAEQRFAIREVPIRARPVARPSRLFTSIPQYLSRSASILVRAYAMFRPLRAFAWLAVPFLVAGVALGLRFLWYFMQDPGRSGHVQSLILAAICIIVGAQVLVFGMLGDLARTNRLLLQDIRSRVRRLELTARREPTPQPPTEPAAPPPP